MATELGRRIQRAREARNWTQQQLADQVGVALRTVGGWESGNRVPRNRLGKLEQVLGPQVNPENDEIRVSRGAGVPPEIEVMFAHYVELSPMDRVRLSRLIMDDALAQDPGPNP